MGCAGAWGIKVAHPLDTSFLYTTNKLTVSKKYRVNEVIRFHA